MENEIRDSVQKALAERRLGIISGVVNIQPVDTDVEKGGKRAVIGEIRTWDGVKYQKTANGWDLYKDKKQTESTEKDESSIIRDTLYNRLQEEKDTLNKNISTKKRIKENIEGFENRLKFTDSENNIVRDKLGYQIEMLQGSLKKVERDIEDNKDRISRFSNKLVELNNKDKQEEQKNIIIENGVLTKVEKGSTSVAIPNSVKEIGYYAFENCYESLESVTIPNSVEKIGIGAFDSCYNLKEINIPNSVKEIGKGAFSYCHSLTNVTIPNSIDTISDTMFMTCKNLESVTIPNSVKEIQREAFQDCTKLESINIPKSVKQIGFQCFEGCTNLKEVHIENPKTIIEKNAFPEHTKITYGTKENKEIENKVELPKDETLSTHIYPGCLNKVIDKMEKSIESGETPSKQEYEKNIGEVSELYSKTGVEENKIKEDLGLTDEYNISTRKTFSKDNSKPVNEITVTFDKSGLPTQRLTITGDGDYELSSSSANIEKTTVETISKQIEVLSKIKNIVENKDLQEKSLAKVDSIISARQTLHQEKGKFNEVKEKYETKFKDLIYKK